jgi:hypothetical protein
VRGGGARSHRHRCCTQGKAKVLKAATELVGDGPYYANGANFSASPQVGTLPLSIPPPPLSHFPAPALLSIA